MRNRIVCALFHVCYDSTVLVLRRQPELSSPAFLYDSLSKPSTDSHVSHSSPTSQCNARLVDVCTVSAYTTYSTSLNVSESTTTCSPSFANAYTSFAHRPHSPTISPFHPHTVLPRVRVFPSLVPKPCRYVMNHDFRNHFDLALA